MLRGSYEGKCSGTSILGDYTLPLCGPQRTPAILGQRPRGPGTRQTLAAPAEPSGGQSRGRWTRPPSGAQRARFRVRPLGTRARRGRGVCCLCWPEPGSWAPRGLWRSEGPPRQPGGWRWGMGPACSLSEGVGIGTPAGGRPLSPAVPAPGSVLASAFRSVVCGGEGGKRAWEAV